MNETNAIVEETNEPRRGRFLLAVASLVFVAGLLLLVLGAAWLAPGLAGANPFGRGDHGDHAAWMRFWVGRTLDRVEATDEQRERVQAVIDGLEPRLEGLHGPRGELHQDFVQVFTAPQVDPAELERVRAEHLERFDQMSREVVGALAEVGAILTEEQRRQLAEMHSHRRRHFMH